MESEHRELIINKSEQLVELIHLDVLLPFVITENIFTIPMLEDIYKEKSDKLRKTKFLHELPTRGPHAFSKFIKTLKAAGDNQAAELLQQNIDAFPTFKESVNQNLSCADRSLNLCTEDANAQKRPLSEVPVKELISNDVYSMKSDPGGYCLIINNVDFNGLSETRLGSDLDAVRLNIVFEYLGYHTSVKRNLTGKKMKNELRDFSRKKEHKSVDSCVVVILTHGLKEAVMSTDEEIIYISDILDMFNNINCPSLKGKPKMFFIQACRGNNYDSGVMKNESTDSVEAFLESSDELTETKDKRTSSLTDMFISYSTIEGYISVRDYYLGSWYCQSLCIVLREYASKYDLLTMLGMVDKEVITYVSSTGDKQATEIHLKGWKGKKNYFNV